MHDDDGRLLAAASASYPTRYAKEYVNLHHRRPHLTGAVLEGVGYAPALCMAPLRHDRDVTGIDVIGAGAASNSWFALLADIWGVPVRRCSITSQASVGAYRALRPRIAERESGKR